MDGLLIGLGAVALVVVIMVMYFVPLGLWIAAMSSGAHVGIGTLVAMRLRRVSPGKIVNPRISAVKAGLDMAPRKRREGSVESRVKFNCLHKQSFRLFVPRLVQRVKRL